MDKQETFSKLVAEFIGTCAIVLFGCGSIAVFQKTNHPELMAFVPLIFGAIVSVMIYSLKNISGAHFNPAVTVALTILKKIHWCEATFYIFSQFLGGIFGSYLIQVFVPGTQTYGSTIPSVGLQSTFMIEFVLTFFLMFVVLTMVMRSEAIFDYVGGLAVGLIVMLGAFLGGPLTGASMNPARSIGPALFEGVMELQWIYILAPCFGALGAAKVCDLFFKPSLAEAEENKKVAELASTS